MTDKPRHIALDLLLAVEKGRRTLDIEVEEVFAANKELDKRDKGFITAIVYGVLRLKARLDYIISYFSKTEKIETVVQSVLRMGLYQIIYMERVPNSAAVNTSVNLVKERGKGKASGFVNGVLRNADRSIDKILYPDPEKNAVNYLSIEYSFPEWMVKRWLSRYGFDETKKILAIVNDIPPLTLRCNTLKTSRDDLIRAVLNDAEEAVSTPFSPDGVFIRNPSIPIFEMDAYKKGFFQVQDEAAQLTSFYAAPLPGERVLDACAGLGGKTGHMAQMMENTGSIIAVDIDKRKLIRLEDEMKRLGIKIVQTHPFDFTMNSVIDMSPFDRVLVDAPCSGLGVLRRNPDGKWNSNVSKVKQAAEKQIKLLVNISQLVKIGGILVYTVCSFEPEENDSVVNRFLKIRPEFKPCTSPSIESHEYDSVIRLQSELIGSDEDSYRDGLHKKNEILRENSPSLKTLPHLHGMDGFYSFRFRRIS